MSNLTHVLQQHDSSTSLCTGSVGFSRSALRRLCSDVAARLAVSGIKPGDVVCMSFANTLECVVSFLAVTWARAVAAPLNPAYKKEENAFYLEDSKAKLLLLPPEGNAPAEHAAADLKVPTVTVRVDAHGSNGPAVHMTPKAGAWKVPPPGSVTQVATPLPSDIALFLHTSGTTGRPKGVPLSHSNLMASLRNIIATYELTNKDVSYLVMPLFHVHGLMAGLLAPMAAGAMVAMPEAGRFTASAFWQDCCKYKATFYTAVPTMHQVLLARAKQDYPAHAPPPLRFIRSCSSALAPATLEQLEATFKVPVLEAYAMTEASHQMCSNPLPKHGPHKPGTVGPPQGGVKVAILDNNNRVLPQGQIGEVCIRGDNVMAGYLNNPTANKDAFAGGWFHTGDQGFLDEDGYVTLTGRLKELINRGGEKISPLEVDAALLTHPAVAEAVSFGAPDVKYGEVVAAAVVLKPGAKVPGIEEDIRKHCGQGLSAFKVPSQIFITDTLPKTATGKIQRRHMVTAFIKPAGQDASKGPANAVREAVPGQGDGYEVVAAALAELGVRHAFGVVGIPVTPLASSFQAAGIRFIGFRNEQAAGYAAAAAGFLSGVPGVLLTVSGPGAVNGIAGASHATVNGMPIIMLSGSAEQADLGKGAFQELDQVEALQQHCKACYSPNNLEDLPGILCQAFHTCTSGRPGATYVDLPSNLLLQRLPGGDHSNSKEAVMNMVKKLIGQVHIQVPEVQADAGCVSLAAGLLGAAKRPIIVVGEGAVHGRAEKEIQTLANKYGLPVLCTSQARGALPDAHPLCVNAARSAALQGADCALVLGARLNWQLHFGETPKWASNVKFILVDKDISVKDADKAAVAISGQIRSGLAALLQEVQERGCCRPEQWGDWVNKLGKISGDAGAKLAKRIASAPSQPMDYYSALGTVRTALLSVHPAPIVVSEGANTMDMSRVLLPAFAPRSRLDAGVWGTMGVGLGYAIASACCAAPGQFVISVEGDSAFGFSGMEVETMQRYQLPIIVLIMNNGGIYGGDRRPGSLAAAAAQGCKQAGFGSDPPPTAFVPEARHDELMKAFGGVGMRATSTAELQTCLRQAISQHMPNRQPVVIDVILDPMAGVESGNVHSFNLSKSKL